MCSFFTSENRILVLNRSRILAFGYPSCYAGKGGIASSSTPVEEVKERWTSPFWTPQSWVESVPRLSSGLKRLHRLRVIFVVSSQHDGGP
jgi:hypothetical protein